jgi:aryl-alcohol dehydrogenase-like predicted oxidoreductase
MKAVFRPGKCEIFNNLLGIGTASWSNTPGLIYIEKVDFHDIQATVNESLDARVNFFDTAETYGNGYVERLVGILLEGEERQFFVATKYAARIRRLFFYEVAAALPVGARRRLVSRFIRSGLEASLRRLQLSSVDLYQIHYPSNWIDLEDWIHAMADMVDTGLARYVGVSNFDVEQTRVAHDILIERGLPLVSNQVEYSLIERKLERNGLFELCRELSITILAYCPLGRGILSGKYRTVESLPNDRRRKYWQFQPESLPKLIPLLDALDETGNAHRGKTPTQVALNWLVRQEGVFPIPGVKNKQQARQISGALGWEMSQIEADLLDQLSAHFR